MKFHQTKLYSAVLATSLILALASTTQTQKQQDCRKGAGGGNPPWSNSGKGCAFKQKPYHYYQRVGYVDEKQVRCYEVLQVCEIRMVREQIVARNPGCPESPFWPDPKDGDEVCCDAFNKAVKSKQPCDPSADADCDGIPNDKDPDPLKSDQKYKEKGFVYTSAVSGHVHQSPSAGSPVIATAAHGSRFLFTDVTEQDGSLWYYANPPGQPAGWIPASEVSCSHPAPLPPGKQMKPEDTGWGLNVHPITAMTTGGRG